MNKVILIGRLTRDPEMRTGETTVASFSVAVNRRFKNKDGKYEADFPNVKAFGKTAEFIEKWFKKGSQIGIVGRIQTGSYTNRDGQKVYTTDVIADEVEFVESKNSSGAQQTTQSAPPTAEQTKTDDFMSIPDGIDNDELPFN